jgi:hypothetical protein
MLRTPPRALGPTAFTLLNAIAFCVVRPGVPDLWAARARASAVGHGVGLTYWFSWFGGSTPGNYSVITPYLSAKVGTELVAAIAAVAVAALVTVLVHDTARPLPAAYVAAFGVVGNLWCGRVAFLVGSAFAVGALLCVRRRIRTRAAVLSTLTVLASPVAGAFVCLGLSGVVLTARLRPYRAAALCAAAGAAGSLIALAVMFGAPGPEPYPRYVLGEIVLLLALMLAAAPPDHLRVTLLVTGLGALAVFAVPNGMGSNLARLALFCLPPAAVALSRRPGRVLAVLAAPVLVLSALSSQSALLSAFEPSSYADYYAPLAAELDTLQGASDYRLELVGAKHAAYAALLDHATLARGWETQQDLAQNAPLDRHSLGVRSYRDWLGDNAVGFVAVDLPGGPTPEARLVTHAPPGLLRPVWRSARWLLLAVSSPTPIVGTPAVLTASTESALTVRIPCACRVALRVRWSRFLAVEPKLRNGVADSVEDAYRLSLAPDREGWTTLTTSRPGTFVLSGSL